MGSSDGTRSPRRGEKVGMGRGQSEMRTKMETSGYLDLFQMGDPAKAVNMRAKTNNLEYSCAKKAKFNRRICNIWSRCSENFHAARHSCV